MDLGKLKVIAMANEKMNWLAQRQKVLAQNVVNVNTPDYEARDLRKITFRDAVERSQASAKPVAMARTSSDHMTPPGQSGDYRDHELRRVYESSPDGNKVVLEEQMIEMSSTRSQYSLATQMISKNMQMIKTALGKNR